MTAKKKEFDWFEAIVFILECLGWYALAELVLGLLFGITILGPALWTR